MHFFYVSVKGLQWISHKLSSYLELFVCALPGSRWWRRAHKLHFMTRSQRRSAAPRSGLRLHCQEKLCATDERLPLKRRHCCLHSGKKSRTFVRFNRPSTPAITPKPWWEQAAKRRVIIQHRHSSRHSIFCAWGGRGWARARFTYRNNMHLNEFFPPQVLFIYGAWTLCAVCTLHSTINTEARFCCSHHRTSPQTRRIPSSLLIPGRRKMSPSSSGAGPAFSSAVWM